MQTQQEEQYQEQQGQQQQQQQQAEEEEQRRVGPGDAPQLAQHRALHLVQSLLLRVALRHQLRRQGAVVDPAAAGGARARAHALLRELQCVDRERQLAKVRVDAQQQRGVPAICGRCSPRSSRQQQQCARARKLLGRCPAVVDSAGASSAHRACEAREGGSREQQRQQEERQRQEEEQQQQKEQQQRQRQRQQQQQQQQQEQQQEEEEEDERQRQEEEEGVRVR